MVDVLVREFFDGCLPTLHAPSNVPALAGKALLERCFDRTLTFSMNDGVVYPGFHPLAHYLITSCRRSSLG